MKKIILLITAAIMPLHVSSLVRPTFPAPVYVDLSGEETPRYDDYSMFDIYQTPFASEVSRFRDNLDAIDTPFSESVLQILSLLEVDEGSNFSEAIYRAMDLVFLAIVDNSKEQIEQLAELSELLKIKKPGVDIFNVTSRDLYPLELARYFKRFSLIKTLKSFGANKTTGSLHDKVKTLDNLKPIHFLVRTGQFEEATNLIREGEDFSGKSIDGTATSLLNYALNFVDYKADECLEFIQEIIDRGYSINENDYDTSIWVDIFYQPWGIKKMDEVVKLFLINGANPNTPIMKTISVYYPLTLAIQIHNVKAVEVLLRARANPNLSAKIATNVGLSRSKPIPYTALSYSEYITKTQRSLSATMFQNQLRIRELLIEYGALRTNEL